VTASAESGTGLAPAPQAGEAAQDFAPGLERAFALEVEPGSFTVPRPAELPNWLRGTAYWNGPGNFLGAGPASGELRYRHWLDGDGLVLAVHLGDDDQGIRVTHRFVESRKRVAEQQAGAPLFRAFGTRFPGDRLERVGIASPVNVSVYPWAGHLLAFGEQGLPWELDPATLETRGEFSFGGALNVVSPWSAHPAINRQGGDLFGFGVSFSASEPCVHFYRFAPGEPPLLRWRRRLALPYPCSIHDFGLSERHAVFHVAPYLLDAEAILRDGLSVMEALRWAPERGGQLLIADRETGAEVARVPIDHYCLHHINAVDDGDHLVVDFLELDRPVYDQYQPVPELFTDVAPGRPVRVVVRMRGAGAAAIVRRERIAYEHAPDFPVVRPHSAGKPYQDFWALGIGQTGRPGRKFMNELVHLRWDRPDRQDLWRPLAGCYLASETVIVDGPDELAALLVLLFDATATATSVLVFDATDVARGPLAQLRLPKPLPALFHGSFAAG
jgi:carotenoid cleavage dioxygenase-like enzyme